MRRNRRGFGLDEPVRMGRVETTLKNIGSGERKAGAAADRHGQFLDRHRPLLLRYLDGAAPPDEPAALDYVDSVLSEWHALFGDCELTEADPAERTFWFALYQLEELAELPGPPTHPYEALLMEDLVEVRELLRHGRPLPEGRFMATRPDGT